MYFRLFASYRSSYGLGRTQGSLVWFGTLAGAFEMSLVLSASFTCSSTSHVPTINDFLARWTTLTYSSFTVFIPSRHLRTQRDKTRMLLLSLESRFLSHATCFLPCPWKKVDIGPFSPKPSLRVTSLLTSLWRLLVIIYSISLKKHDLSTCCLMRLYSSQLALHVLLLILSSCRTSVFLKDGIGFSSSQHTYWLFQPHKRNRVLLIKTYLLALFTSHCLFLPCLGLLLPHIDESSWRILYFLCDIVTPMPSFGCGIWFFITALHAGTWYSQC